MKSKQWYLTEASGGKQVPGFSVEIKNVIALLIYVSSKNQRNRREKKTR